MKRNFRTLWVVLLGVSFAASLTGCGGSGGDGSNKTTTTTTAPAGPSVPTGVSATSGNAQATISWNAVTGATSYNIYWATTSTRQGRLLFIIISSVTKTSGTKIAGVTSPYTHTGLTNGTTYQYVVTAVNNAGESAESSVVSAKPTILPITSLSTTSSLPTGNLIINGTGFATDGSLSVRFFNSSGYKVDVQVMQSTSTSVVVAVPPYFVSGANKFEPGTVSVQVLQDTGSGIIKSNSIEGFQIKDLPTHTATPGNVTLNFLRDELYYYTSLQNGIKNTSLDTPSMNTAIADTVDHLTALASVVRVVVKNQSATFDLGSVSGIALSVGSKELLQSDRLILGMFTTLASSDLPAVVSACTDPTQTADLLVPLAAVSCQAEANAQFQNLRDYEATYAAYAPYQNCYVTRTPPDINKGFNYMTALGGVGLGILALAGAPEIALALPAAALLYISVMGINTQFAIGAELHYINDDAALEALHNGYEQTVKLFTDTIIGKATSKVFGETAGNLLGLFGDLKTTIQTFAETTQTSPLAGSWSGTYYLTLTAYGCTFHHKGDMTTTLTVSGNNVTGTGTWTGVEVVLISDCSVVETNTVGWSLIGTITGNTVTGKIGPEGEIVDFTGTFNGSSFSGNLSYPGYGSGAFSLTKK